MQALMMRRSAHRTRLREEKTGCINLSLPDLAPSSTGPGNFSGKPRRTLSTTTTTRRCDSCVFTKRCTIPFTSANRSSIFIATFKLKAFLSEALFQLLKQFTMVSYVAHRRVIPSPESSEILTPSNLSDLLIPPYHIHRCITGSRTVNTPPILTIFSSFACTSRSEPGPYFLLVGGQESELMGSVLGVAAERVSLSSSPNPIQTLTTDIINVAMRLKGSVVAHHPLPSASSYSAKPIANNFKLLNVIELPEVAAK
ncbi:hypothetical protein DY000_02002678 [Brassica cretica]|uniref:Uncharacterized protein n=1 Tax=Brassica cretica TaxID=69181 RepID=A0ABQ7C7E8_BRACR|nr:hypothetical protein DY000_02002678 [Brassica cretica]